MAAIDYTSTAELASYVSDFASDPSTSLGAMLGLLITRVSRQIDTYTKRQFWTSTADDTGTYDGNGTYRFIPQLDIVSITTLKLAVDTRAASSGTFTTIDPRDYYLQPRQSRAGWPYSWIELSNSPVGDYSTSYTFTAFPLGYGTIKPTWKTGWNATGSTAIPDDIRHAASELVIRAWRARNMNFSDVIGMEGLQVAPFSRGMPYDIREILDGYKRKSVG